MSYRTTHYDKIMYSGSDTHREDDLHEILCVIDNSEYLKIHKKYYGDYNKIEESLLSNTLFQERVRLHQLSEEERRIEELKTSYLTLKNSNRFDVECTTHQGYQDFSIDRFNTTDKYIVHDCLIVIEDEDSVRKLNNKIKTLFLDEMKTKLLSHNVNIDELESELN